MTKSIKDALGGPVRPMAEPNRTALDHICDLLADQHIDDNNAARELHAMMVEYGNRYPRTFRQLTNVPGFRKLWNAVGEMVQFSVREES